MSARIETCTRCDSKIVETPHGTRGEHLRLVRDVGDNGYEAEDARLCSVCWDELWDWAFGDGVPDRSDRADPEPLDHMAESVERHVESLKGILADLNDAAEGDV